MGEIEFTHHGVYANAWFHWYSRGFSPLAVELLNARRAIDYLVTRPDLDRQPNRSDRTIRRRHDDVLPRRARRSDRRVGAGVGNAVDHGLDRAPAVGGALRLSVSGQQLRTALFGDRRPDRARVQLLVNADADRGFPWMPSPRWSTRSVRSIACQEERCSSNGRRAGRTLRHRSHQVARLFLLPQGVPGQRRGDHGGRPGRGATSGNVDLFPGRAADRRAADANRRNAHPVSGGGIITRREPTRLDSMICETSCAKKSSGITRHSGHRSRRNGARSRLRKAEGSGRSASRPSKASAPKPSYSLPADADREQLPAVSCWSITARAFRSGATSSRWSAISGADRAVLMVETLDRGSRALEQNLRSFTDDDLLHHMKRQAMVAGTTLESMQVYEVLRSLELLRSLPDVDRGQDHDPRQGSRWRERHVRGAPRREGDRVVLHSPPASHLHGPHYLGVLRHTDIPETAALLGQTVRVLGEAPGHLAVGRDVRLPAGVPARPLTEVTHCTLAVTDALPNKHERAGPRLVAAGREPREPRDREQRGLSRPYDMM